MCRLGTDHRHYCSLVFLIRPSTATLTEVHEPANTMTKRIIEAVQELCLGLPEAEEINSHGHPGFRVRQKLFAYYCVNHHGDGRVALWLNSPPGIQHANVSLNPGCFFVPPYFGPAGWLGVELNKGMDWSEISRLVYEAYVHKAPKRLASGLDGCISIIPPDEVMTAADINPLLVAGPSKLVSRLDRHCRRFPEVTEGLQFGSPVWKAGKKTFAGARHAFGRLIFQFWVGIDQQAMLTEDDRYSIPDYMGNKGWINLDVDDAINWDEIDYLLETSFRHFALKRMIKSLAK